MTLRVKGGVIGITQIITDLLKVPQRLRRMEHHMTQMDDAIQQLNSATDEIASDLERLRGEVAGGDTSAAERLGPIIDRLRSLGADPENPVPEPPPTA